MTVHAARACVAAVSAAGLVLACGLSCGLSCCARPCPRYPHTDPDVALETHRTSVAGVHVIRGHARVDQRGREGRVRGEVMMFIEAPASVRFDAMTQFGPASILTSDGTLFALADLRENRFLVGPPCPRNIERLLGIPMSGEEVARLLLGDTPLIEATTRSLECTSDGTYRIVLRAADGAHQDVELDVPEADREKPAAEQRLFLVRSEVYDARGRTVWRVTFDDHRKVRMVRMVRMDGVDPGDGGDASARVTLPFEVRFEHPSSEADVLVKFDSIDVNVAVPEGAFTQMPRSGLLVEAVSCGDAPTP